jgi:hypothetical protein
MFAVKIFMKTHSYGAPRQGESRPLDAESPRAFEVTALRARHRFGRNLVFAGWAGSEWHKFNEFDVNQMWSAMHCDMINQLQQFLIRNAHWEYASIFA